MNRPRIFLPLAVLMLLFVLFNGTFLQNWQVFYDEIGWVRANADGSAVDKLETLIDRWEADAASELLYKEELVELDGLAARVLDKHFVRDTDYSYSVVRDNHGWLQFITYPAKIRPIVQNIAEYQALGYPLIYVQPPTKFIEGYTEFPATLNDQTAANAAQTRDLLLAAGVPYFDLREQAEAQQLNKEQLFYRTDHHWRVETAFWAVGQTVDYLNGQLGFNIDADGFYRDIENWEQTTWQQNFLGSQGRRVGRFYGGLDDFTLLTPAFETDLQVVIDDYDGEGQITREGSFNDVLLDWDMLNDEDVYTNRYGAYWGADYPTVLADNRQNEDGPTVLIVKDSYSLPYGAFLATMVDKLYMVDLRYYDLANLAGYIEEIQPDVILIMYS